MNASRRVFLSGWLLAHNLSEQASLALFAEVKRQAAAALKNADRVVKAKTRRV
ncbi:hypothetical protein QW180_22125 [Vibrio sinaloensis]|nr:hypothetical protein [Vibrio sinaloensis]